MPPVVVLCLEWACTVAHAVHLVEDVPVGIRAAARAQQRHPVMDVALQAPQGQRQHRRQGKDGEGHKDRNDEDEVAEVMAALKPQLGPKLANRRRVVAGGGSSGRMVAVEGHGRWRTHTHCVCVRTRREAQQERGVTPFLASVFICLLNVQLSCGALARTAMEGL